MVRHSMSRCESGLAGFTLLEVLVAVLLCAVPVVAAQRLMLRSADSVRFASQQALAVRAAANTLDRIYAYHVGGLWPQGAVPTGRWLDGLNADIASEEPPQSTLNCVNRWCSSDQWAAFEGVALGCALNGDWVADFCASIAPTPLEIKSGIEQPRVPIFRASLAASSSLGLRVRWPKAHALPEPTELEEWHQIILGDHP